ncbi:MAG: hypothetical protein WC489_03810 [Patescibacteria group bacterium]
MKNDVIQKKQPGILWLRGSNLAVFVEGMPQILSFSIDSNTLTDMEIIDETMLNEHIHVFFSTNKIPPASFTLILAKGNMIVKDFAALPEGEVEKQINTYLEYAPFENIYSKKIPLEKGQRIIISNADMYHSFNKAIVSSGSHIDAIIPLLCLDKTLQGQEELTPDIVQYIIKNKNAIKQQGFQILKQQELSYLQPTTPQDQNKKSTLPYLLVIMAILVVLLIIIYFQSQKPVPKKIVPASTSSVLNRSLVPTSVSSESASILQNLKDVPVRISGGADLNSRTDMVLQSLKKAGFMLIEIDTTPIETPKTLVIFSAATTQPVKDTMNLAVKEIDPDFIVQESDRKEPYINIILRRNIQ